MSEYIEREAFLEQKVWLQTIRWTSLRNCAETNSLSRYKRELMKQAADAIEELMRYVQQMEKLRQEGWYLQKTKMMTYGQATMTMPLLQPPKEE